MNRHFFSWMKLESTFLLIIKVKPLTKIIFKMLDG